MHIFIFSIYYLMDCRHQILKFNKLKDVSMPKTKDLIKL